MEVVNFPASVYTILDAEKTATKGLPSKSMLYSITSV